MKHVPFGVLVCLVTTNLALAAEPPAARAGYQIVATLIDETPIIDGRLDDAAWQRAQVIENFTQQESLEGAPATEWTQVLVLYDATHLYIALRAFDSNPDGIVATEMRRDSTRLLNDEDSFQIIIDTFNDSRSGYMFVTNPLGAKLEQQIFEEGEGAIVGANSNVNRNWDGVWDVRLGARTKAGSRSSRCR